MCPDTHKKESRGFFLTLQQVVKQHARQSVFIRPPWILQETLFLFSPHLFHEAVSVFCGFHIGVWLGGSNWGDGTYSRKLSPVVFTWPQLWLATAHSKHRDDALKESKTTFLPSHSRHSFDGCGFEKRSGASWNYRGINHYYDFTV